VYASFFLAFFFWLQAHDGGREFAGKSPAGNISTRHSAIQKSARPEKFQDRKPILFEMPALKPGEVPVYHLGYALVYNEPHEQATWVAYELTAAETEKVYGRSDRFRQDPLVVSGTADDADYAGSGYDRGHLAPAADMGWSATAMEESFYYSNMSPQAPSFNRGIWKKGEDLIRTWARAYGRLFIATGPVLDARLPKIGPAGVSVPRFFFKVVLDTSGPEKKGIGFWIPNQGSALPLSAFAYPIDSIEAWTGLNFFPKLSLQTAHLAEGSLCLECWSWGKTKFVNGPKRKPYPAMDTEQLVPGYKSEGVANQCLGTTKKGVRCRRKTRSANGFCWQHGG
jgi:endonuclease G